MLSSEWEKNLPHSNPESPHPQELFFLDFTFVDLHQKSPQNQCVKTTLYTRRLPSRFCCFDKYMHD